MYSHQTYSVKYQGRATVVFYKLCRTARSSRSAQIKSGVSDNDGSRMVDGSEFQRVGPETAHLVLGRRRPQRSHSEDTREAHM